MHPARSNSANTNNFLIKIGRIPPLFLGMGILWLALVGGYVAYAQETGNTLQVLHSNTLFSNDVVTVQTYFYAEQEIDNVRVVLDDERVPSTQQRLEKLNDEEFHLIVLYDASGSMRPAAAEMRAQADLLLNQLPSNAQIAIYRFSDSVILEEPFSPKGSAREELMSAIDELQMTTSATCLYDGLSHVVAAAGQVSPNTPRRAVLLLSDGRDEKTQGQNDTCSRNNEADIINQATALTPPLPIFTLGFQGSEPADEATLMRLAEETGGRFAMDEGQPLFRDLNRYFANQWLLQVKLFPAPGEHAGEIIAATNNGESLTQPFAFTAEEDYRPVVIAPEPLRVELRNITYLPRLNRYEAEYFFSNPTLAQSLNWQIQVTNSVSPSLQIVRTLPISDTQPQTLRFLNTVPGDPQPDFKYIAEIRPAAVVPEGIDLQISQPLEWIAPSLPELAIDTEITGLRTQQLLITYTLSSPQFVSSIEGYVWEVNTSAVPYTFSIPIEPTNQLTVIKGTEPIDIGNNFGVYSITTYLRRDDTQYLNVPPLERTVDNTLWGRFTSWTFTAFPDGLQLFGFLLIPTLLVLLGIYLLVRSWRNRPLPPPPPPAAPTMVQPTTNGTAVRVVASPDKSHIGESIPIDADLFYIGREGCNLNLEDDRQISRRHAAIERKEDGLYITDLNSRNGTFLDGQRLSPNQRHRLEGILEIKLGTRTRLKFS